MSEYRRCQGKNYLVLCENRMEQAETYEISMLTENRICSMLPLFISANGREREYWYEMTGYQDLTGFAGSHKIGADFLVKLLFALEHAVAEFGSYLLDTDSIQLEADKIFVDAEQKEIRFCYLPGVRKPVMEALCELMDYYIQHMEHSDQNEIGRCYEIYDRCHREGSCLWDLLAFAGHPTDREDPLWNGKTGTGMDEKGFDSSDIEETDFSVKTYREKIPHRRMFADRRTHRQKISGIIRLRQKKVTEDPFVILPQDMEKESKATVLLGSEIEVILGELRYEGDGREKNLVLTSSPYRIGSLTGEVDGEIHASGVSRIHAEITKEGESYYLEDLNSTNGTVHNGKELCYHEKVQLEKNDTILFAGEKYRFI